jgi:hypothetical protein
MVFVIRRDPRGDLDAKRERSLVSATKDRPGHEEREGDTKDTKKILLNKQEID